ncbi:putative DNA repair protein DNA polymerase, kappa [Emiliania huxleyi CCMP1516]|uniref:DNA polymerase kappa n=2 Tax=Emiliania huxleyi TaxID=2903 RepID=A0A0D3IAG6_EMIH1|nr:putative DNA repair protein DNA polymerase, kappa [Emiliania huxleyi CCMP1516]EOD08251.1 putative DNA repair protein DNA polymerase, kappa [Emiliania huxleyi CCMP1516]|eukprot:XP_005760680.1 putative DNA repair protein DNA polymerase, kappa [Emiliania huxleyi CCMP1516]
MPRSPSPSPPAGQPSTASDAGDAVKAIYVFANEKGGMTDINRGKINEIIAQLSQSSAYTAKLLKSDRRVDETVALLQQKLQRSDEGARRSAAAVVARQVAALEASRRADRCCAVIDFDMFYAAVEIRDRPELADKPVAVGGIGMISTANYVARRWGVRSAMPGFIGQALCRQLVFVRPDFAKYTAVAEVARAIFREYDPKMTAGSLDEAYLDLTDHLHKRARDGGGGGAGDDSGDCDGGGEGERRGTALTGEALGELAGEVVGEIRARVKEATRGLTTSAGIGPNFLLAKIAADVRKPDGQFCTGWSREAVLSFLAPLPVRKVPGVGRVMEKARARKDGAASAVCELLSRAAEARLLFTPGSADSLLRKSLGWEEGGREEAAGEALQKGISCERTFRPTGDEAELGETLRRLCASLAEEMAARQLRGRTVTLKMKTSDFDLLTRDSSAARPVGAAEELQARAVMPLTVAD